MEELHTFCEITRDFKDVADFALLYIGEAHPIDGWYAEGFIEHKIATHQSLEDRLAAAQILVPQCSDIPVLVDTMTDQANYNYGAIPERLYVILDGTVVYVGGCGPHFYNLDEIKTWLTGFKERKLE